MWSRERRIAAALLLAASSIMLLPLVLLWSGRDIPVVQDLGFTPGRLAPPHAWAAGILFAALYVAYTFRVIPFVREQQHELSMFKLIGVIAAFASGIMEEVVFRRWLMDMAMIQGVGWLGQMIVSGLIFGLAHMVWHAFSRDRRFSIFAALSTCVAGLALAGIYLLGGRNLGPCIAAHVLINLVIEPWLVLSAVSGSTLPRPEEGAIG